MYAEKWSMRHQNLLPSGSQFSAMQRSLVFLNVAMWGGLRETSESAKQAHAVGPFHSLLE